MMTMLALSAALAQDNEQTDTLNAHGFFLAPQDADLLDPLAVYRAERQVKNGFGFTGIAEYASKPLVLYESRNGGPAEPVVLLDNLTVLNLALQYSVGSRLGIGVTMPVVLTSSNAADGLSTFAASDLRLVVPIGLVIPDESGAGVGLSLIPLVDLPIGAKARYLGNEGIGAGGVVAFTAGSPTFNFSANIGAALNPNIDFENLQGGARLLASLSVAQKLTDHLALRGELTSVPKIPPNPDRGEGNETPMEVLLSARGDTESGFHWTGGGALGLIGGAGSAAFRVFLGAGMTLGKALVPDTDGDGFKDDVDDCVENPETVNTWKDDDGCPDQLAAYTVTVIDEDKKVVKDAKVVIAGKEYMTDAAGKVSIPDLMPGTQLGAAVSHPYFGDGSAAASTLAEGPNDATVKLDYKDGQIKVVVRSEAGPIPGAKLTFEGGPEKRDAIELGDDGDELVNLRPGKWAIAISAPTFSTDRREIEIAPGERSLVEINIAMIVSKAVLQETRKEILILEQVQFDFDKDTIKPESFGLLDNVASVILDHSYIQLIEVQGHTDDVGVDAYNLDLSQRRVESVRTYLIGKGVKPDVLVAKGYGESVPVKPNSNEKNRALNRRVQFVILRQDLGGENVEIQNKGSVPGK